MLYTSCPTQPCLLADLLTEKSGLSKSKIKDALAKGAVWLSSDGKKFDRIRKVNKKIDGRNTIKFYYDPHILEQTPPAPELVGDYQTYSVWDKPPGVLAQGTSYGDHCSLVRISSIFFHPHRPSYPVHRLDREASGLSLIAHSQKSAALLSALFLKKKVEKHYVVEVLGIWEGPDQGVIELPLDKKSASTTYRILSTDKDRNMTTIDASITTGRLHQIRRHCSMMGHPVLGDPRYGTGNKNSSGLRLRAVQLSFDCPILGIRQDFRLSAAP